MHLAMPAMMRMPPSLKAAFDLCSSVARPFLQKDAHHPRTARAFPSTICSSKLCGRRFRRARSARCRRTAGLTGCCCGRGCALSGQRLLAERANDRSEVGRHDLLATRRADQRTGRRVGRPKAHDVPLSSPRTRSPGVSSWSENSSGKKRSPDVFILENEMKGNKQLTVGAAKPFVESRLKWDPSSRRRLLLLSRKKRRRGN